MEILQLLHTSSLARQFSPRDISLQLLQVSSMPNLLQVIK